MLEIKNLYTVNQIRLNYCTRYYRFRYITDFAQQFLHTMQYLVKNRKSKYVFHDFFIFIFVQLLVYTTTKA